MDEQQIYFEPSPGMYRFFEGIEDEDSGVEDLPFTNYVSLDDSNAVHSDIFDHSVDATTLFDHDEDELAFLDDDKDEDYKPKMANLTKRGHTKIAKRRQYPNTSLTEKKILMLTPEKQIVSQYDTDSNSSIRHYARKDRTPNTIKKMMERHRESERVRHHSLNESLKDVCMRVPGYDPGAKETKVIQMQRIIGYECFLENTFRALCEQLNVPSKLTHKFNNQFISDAMNNTPIENFYQPSSYRTNDGDDDEEENNRLVALLGRENNHSQRAIKSAKFDDPRILKYRREKISSPTVDSTTDNIVRLGPIYQKTAFHDVETTPRYMSQFESNIYWNKEQTGFKTIDISQESSQESGVKVETQSSLDDDNHFHDINNLIGDELYNESEHLRTVTPSFMREETVSTSTNMEDTDEGFDLSSPVRHRNSVFLHSPPARGIWHSVSKHHLPDKADTPGHKEMESVSPENILETKPKIDSCLMEPSTTSKYHSSIRPMTEILSSTANKHDLENNDIFQQGPECKSYPMDLYNNTLHFTKVTPSNHYNHKSAINTSKTEPFQSIGNKPCNRTSSSGTASTSGMQKRGKELKTVPVRNVKIQIVHASPSQRSVPSKFIDSRSVSSTSSWNEEQNISSVSSNLVDIYQNKFGQCSQVRKIENHNSAPVGQSAATQLKRIPVPAISTLQQFPGTVSSSRQYTMDLWSPQAKNKRKRYTPFRSPFRDRYYEESDEENWSPQLKKTKLSGQDHIGGEAQKLQTRSKQETTPTAHIEWSDIENSEATFGDGKVDLRRSTWMNGFMMFSQLNRQKYISENPGAHVSVIQKLLGHKWRSMSFEEQQPYREKANHYSGLMKLTQSYPGTIVDSSISSGTGTQKQHSEPGTSQEKEDLSIIPVAPGYWHF